MTTPAAAGGGDAPVDAPVVVVADDLIWATRLVGQLRTLGMQPVRAASIDALADAVGPARLDSTGRPAPVVVDLTARGYDGLAVIRAAVEAGSRVLAVGQHDDAALRRAALAAGAERVYAYRALFEHGHATLAAWLGIPAPEPGSREMPPVDTRREAPAP